MIPYRRGSASGLRPEAIAQIALALLQDRSQEDRPYRDLRLLLGTSSADAFQPAISLASGGSENLLAVTRGEVDVATVDPAAYLTMAYRGTGPFAEPMPLRALAVIPSWDRMGLAVAKRTGLRSLGDIAKQRYPLRVSVRADAEDATRVLLDELFGLAGFSLQDIVRWGGSIHEGTTPAPPDRLRMIADGSLDAVFDEGIYTWGPQAFDAGMSFLTLDDDALRHLEDLGWPVGDIPATRFPQVNEPVITASFSGVPIFTRANLPEVTAHRVCAALEAVLPWVDWGRDQPSGMADFCTDSDLAPLGIPLHAGAERYYRERGYLPTGT